MAGSAPRGHVGADPGPVEEGIRRPGTAPEDARGPEHSARGLQAPPPPRIHSRRSEPVLLPQVQVRRGSGK
jgi:hypothetical protein